MKNIHKKRHIAVAAGTIYFSYQQNVTSMQLAQDQQQETTLQSYLDHMQDLLLNYHLHESKLGDEVRQVARTLTLTVLQRLDGNRKGIVMRFIHEAGLISAINEIIDMSGADLRYVNLAGFRLLDVDLEHLNLSNANLSGCDLSNITLVDDNLSNANLETTDLGGTDLEGDNLSSANLSNAQTISVQDPVSLDGKTRIDIKNTDLSNAKLNHANLSGADLSGSNVYSKEMYNTYILTGADLTDANLTGAKVTNDQLAQAKSLSGAIMPDGSKHP